MKATTDGPGPHGESRPKKPSKRKRLEALKRQVAMGKYRVDNMAIIRALCGAKGYGD